MRPPANVFNSLRLTAALLAGLETTILSSAADAAPAAPTTRPVTESNAARVGEDDETNERVAEKVDPRRRLPTIDLRDVALVDVFELLRDASGVNLYVNWPALELAGIDRSTPITLRLRNVPLRTVLDLTLREASKNGVPLSWYVADNIVHVTTKELSDRQLITRVYPVQDLIIDIPNFEGPTLQLGAANSTGGGQSPFTDTGNDTTDRQTADERGEALAELIKTLIRPDVWIDNGGYANIRYFNGTLIVTAPLDVLAQIGG